MMEVVVQIFGGAGLIETMVELAYVVSNRQRFNSFEGKRNVRAALGATTACFPCAISRGRVINLRHSSR